MDFKDLFQKKKTIDNNVYVYARRTKHDGGRKQIAIGTEQIM